MECWLTPPQCLDLSARFSSGERGEYVPKKQNKTEIVGSISNLIWLCSTEAQIIEAEFLDLSDCYF